MAGAPTIAAKPGAKDVGKMMASRLFLSNAPKRPPSPPRKRSSCSIGKKRGSVLLKPVSGSSAASQTAVSREGYSSGPGAMVLMNRDTSSREVMLLGLKLNFDKYVCQSREVSKA